MRVLCLTGLIDNSATAGVKLNAYYMKTQPFKDVETGELLPGQELGKMVLDEAEPLLGEMGVVRAHFDHGPEV